VGFPEQTKFGVDPIDEAIGPIVATFSQSRLRLAGLSVAAILFAAPGIGILILTLFAVEHPKPRRQSDVIIGGLFMGAIGIAFIFAGYRFARIMWRSRRNTIVLGRQGICWKVENSAGTLRWQEFVSVCDFLPPQRTAVNPIAGILGVIIPQARYFTIRTAARQNVVLSTKQIGQGGKFRTAFKQLCIGNGVNWSNKHSLI
jgi:hypothetical protein